MWITKIDSCVASLATSRKLEPPYTIYTNICTYIVASATWENSIMFVVICANFSV